MIATPTLIYPVKDSDDFDPAFQIEVWQDSSFLLTDEGVLYSWGKNEHDFLCRETKLDQRSGTALTFSNTYP